MSYNGNIFEDGKMEDKTMENKKSGLFAGLPTYKADTKKTDDTTWAAMETLVSWAIHGTAPAALRILAARTLTAWRTDDLGSACRIARAALSSDYDGSLALSAMRGGPWMERK